MHNPILNEQNLMENESLEASGATWDKYTVPGELKTISEEKSTSHLVQNGSHFGSLSGSFWIIVAIPGRSKVENRRFLGILLSGSSLDHFLVMFVEVLESKNIDFVCEGS